MLSTVSTKKEADQKLASSAAGNMYTPKVGEGNINKLN